jgi:Kef-type K+ transport system membrane component KefB
MFLRFRAPFFGNLKFLSQIGLILFMFVIGMELDIKVLKNKASEAVVISHASIVIPLRWVLVCLILCLTDLPEGSVSFFSLFMELP